MPDFPPEPTTEKTAATHIADTLKSTEESAAQSLEAGEACVSQHPVSAITSTFIGGLAVGLLVGWGIAQVHHHTYREACRELASDWLHRLHLD